jgi:hypothetical protein
MWGWGASLFAFGPVPWAFFDHLASAGDLLDDICLGLNVELVNLGIHLALMSDHILGLKIVEGQSFHVVATLFAGTYTVQIRQHVREYPFYRVLHIILNHGDSSLSL